VNDVDYEPPYLYPDYRSTVLRAPKHEPVKLPDEWFHKAPGPVFGRIPVRAEDLVDLGLGAFTQHYIYNGVAR
jgi:hypothetical protein